MPQNYWGLHDFHGCGGKRTVKKLAQSILSLILLFEGAPPSILGVKGNCTKKNFQTQIGHFSKTTKKSENSSHQKKKKKITAFDVATLKIL